MSPTLRAVGLESPPREHMTEGYVARRFDNYVRWGGPSLENQMHAFAAVEDGALTLGSRLYVECQEGEHQLDSITLEDFDAYVTLLVALRRQLFTAAGIEGALEDAR